MLGPAALAAWLDDDRWPFEKMYMPCGAGLKGNCPCAVGESAKDASANAGNTINKRRAHVRFRISTQNTRLKRIFCLYIPRIFLASTNIRLTANLDLAHTGLKNFPWKLGSWEGLRLNNISAEGSPVALHIM